MKNLGSIFACSTVLLLSACSGTPEAPSPATGVSAAALPSEGAVASLTGTWDFVLDASDVAAKVHKSCDGQSSGDKVRSDACYAEVQAEGATEKIRFSSDGAGHTLWTSFGDKDGKITLFLEAPIDLSSESPTRVVGKVAGPLKGIQAESVKDHMPVGTVVGFEIVDAKTIAMSDPAKGRLVFRRE
jgi:hypothetical protein